MRSVVTISLLFAGALGMAWLVRGQDIAPAPTVGNTTVVNMAPASSVRVEQPLAYFTDAHPPDGGEGTLGMPTDDPNHTAVWHLNHWRFSTVSTSVTP